MLSASSDFRNSVYATEREFKGRATIEMDAYNQIDGRAFSFTTGFEEKINGDTDLNPNIAKYIGSQLTRLPSYTGWSELTQGYYWNIQYADSSSQKITTSVGGANSNMLFSFNIIELMERQFGKYIWGGATTLADKIAKAKTMITKYTATVNGYAVNPSRTTFTNGVRYIRDWLNGNTVNPNNYWNEVEAWSGTLDRAKNVTPTISSGTLANAANVNDGNESTYGYEASGNGVAKYIQVDLGATYYDINAIKIFHYYADGRTFHGTKTQYSPDGVTWYTVFDSAVSGEYVETSSGKMYTGTGTYGREFNFTVYDVSTNAYATEVSHSNSTFQTLTQIPSAPNNVLDATGFVHFRAYSNSTDASSESAIYVDYCTLLIEGEMTDVRVYDDDGIMAMNIVEEMSILNETLPANQLDLTLDNSSGELDLVNFANMSQVIASKPVIKTELGIVTAKVDAQDVTSNYSNKIKASLEENPNTAWYVSGGTTVQISPYDTLTEFTQSAYDSLALNDGQVITISTTAATSGKMAEYMFTFDVLSILENQFGTSIWRGKTDLADKVAIARVWVESVDWNIWCKATSPTGNNVTISRWNLTSWYGGWKYTNADITNYPIGSSTAYNFIDDNGKSHVLIQSDPSDAVTSSTISCEYVEIILTVKDLNLVEWFPSGVFFLTDWKNDVTNKIISMTCNDYFAMLSDISYTPTASTNLKTIAAEVLTIGGVPTSKQIIDNSLSNITVNNFPDRIACRDALQHIGIASRSAVFQDREGNVVIEPFSTIDEVTNYVVYPSTQNVLFGYPGTGTYALNSTGGGMKYLDFEQMYEAPQVSLEKSIYQLVINIYSTVGADPTEQVYTNADINGVGGQSFTIDNPLIKDVATADKIADWYIREMNYNMLFSVNWRQNPILECADVILIEDSFGTEKQSRIIRQEFTYDGSLSGITESRGGV